MLDGMRDPSFFAIAKSGPFEQDRMTRCRSAIHQIRSETKPVSDRRDPGSSKRQNS
jgi:hypothetical protein